MEIRTFEHHSPNLKRPLLLIQEIFKRILPMHVTELPIARNAYTTIDRSEGSTYGPRSPLAQFLYEFLLRVSYDTIFTDRFFTTSFLPVFKASPAVQDFLFDLHITFKSSWAPNQREYDEVCACVVDGLITLDRELLVNRLEVENKTSQLTSWELPSEILIRIPNQVEVKKLITKNNGFLLTLALLHLSRPNPIDILILS
ncbi:MAG: hypothetical protein M0R77_00505 [Gammaproteobacteria bacterium]|nr:hypothetical protein [Acholeplasmataceae bacterium]MCK9529035.1 hypothetical protein [Gammaproteobacteria bacterium]